MTTSDAEDDRSRSGSPDDSDGELEGMDMAEQSDERDGNAAQNGSKPSNAKDPSRPRRKKARRACYACQRAHLTCGESDCCDLSRLSRTEGVTDCVIQEMNDRARGASNVAYRMHVKTGSGRRQSICMMLPTKP